jgi:hypothetical protein
MCTQVLPPTPSRARFSASRPYSRACSGPRLHVGLVELHHVGAGGEQVADLRVYGRGIIHRRRGAGAVVIVLCLLRHGEGAGHGELDRPVRQGAQEAHVLDAHRVAAADRARDPRHEHGLTAAIERLARIVEVDAIQGVGEMVGVALAGDLAVADDIQSRGLLRRDRQADGIALRLLEVRVVHAPQLLGARARGKLPGLSLARSISHSGCGRLPTMVQGNRGRFMRCS